MAEWIGIALAAAAITFVGLCAVWPLFDDREVR